VTAFLYYPVIQASDQVKAAGENTKTGEKTAKH
jgi:hypothetical protein